MDGQEIHKNQGIQVITRAADILRLLGQETEGLSLGQIAKKVHLPRSTVQRIVGALAVEGFITIENRNGGIRLGPEIQALAQAATLDMKDRLRPLMKRISAETGETVDLAILDGRQMLFIDQVEGTQRLRTVSSIGETFPLTTTANGKSALSCMDPAEMETLISGEVAKGILAPRAVPGLKAELALIRSGELARDESEHTDGISALGFAVQDEDRNIFAISVPVPTTRYLRLKDDLAKTINTCRASATY